MLQPLENKNDGVIFPQWIIKKANEKIIEQQKRKSFIMALREWQKPNYYSGQK